MSYKFKAGDLVRVRGTETTGRLNALRTGTKYGYLLKLPASRCGDYGMTYTESGHYLRTKTDGEPDLELIEAAPAAAPSFIVKP